MHGNCHWHLGGIMHYLIKIWNTIKYLHSFTVLSIPKYFSTKNPNVQQLIAACAHVGI